MRVSHIGQSLPFVGIEVSKEFEEPTDGDQLITVFWKTNVITWIGVGAITLEGKGIDRGSLASFECLNWG